MKAEGLQPTGSFKVRGALNMISLLAQDNALGKGGLLTFSLGNHGQAVAWAARKLGVPAVVLMPHAAPETKIRITRAWGAEVILYNRPGDDRELIGRTLASERDLTIIPPLRPNAPHETGLYILGQICVPLCSWKKKLHGQTAFM